MATVFATDGIVTRVNDVGTSDKLINIITPEHGRIAVMVKGGRSPSNKNTPISQLFTYGNYEIYSKGSMFWLRGGSIINPFYDLSTDISKMALAAYLCDLANEMTDEDDGENYEILRLLLNSLYLIEKEKKPPELVKAVFELRSAALSGYCPEVSYCSYCREPYADLMYLDVMGGKLVCSDCLAKRAKKVSSISKDFEDTPETSVICGMSPSVTAAVRFIVNAPDEKIFSFNLKDDIEMHDLSRACEAYILNHLGRGFDSLDFYKTVK